MIVYKKLKRNSTINGYGVSAVRIIGIIKDIKLTFSGKCDYVGDISVVNSNQVPLLLGMDWLSSGRLILDLENMILVENTDGHKT
jgi:hypothetical protein